MLILNKILPLTVLPLGWAFVLATYAMVTRKRWPIAVAALLLYVSAMPATGAAVLGGLENRFPPVPVNSVQPAGAIVVLGGIFGPPMPVGYVPNLSETGERLEAGIQLWHASAAQWLVFTGGQLPWLARAELEGELSKRVAIDHGVPRERILVTRPVGNTMDESLAVAELARAHGWQNVLLVTTAWHMPRATRLFRNAGVATQPFPVDYRFDPSRPFTLLDFIPSAGALACTEVGLREYLGLAFYTAKMR